MGLSILCVSACSPGLDWREVRPEGAQALALFPCKPEVTRRASMGLAQCKAGSIIFSLSWAELPDPAQVSPALKQMRESLVQKMAVGSALATVPRGIAVPGMTPDSQALSQRLSGVRQQAQVAVFSRGPRVYQAVMLSERRDDAAWESFFGSIKLEVK